MDKLNLTDAESKATYEKIKDYVLKHMGIKGQHFIYRTSKAGIWYY